VAIRDAVATASASGALAVHEQLFADAAKEYADALDASEGLDAADVNMSRLEFLRDKVFDEMIRFYDHTSADPTVGSFDFRRAEVSWAALLKRVFGKAE
jgi:hypothetical protein